MKTLLTSLLILAAMPAMAARPEVHGDPEYRDGIGKVNDALALVNVADSNWRIFIVSEKQWSMPLSKEHRARLVGSCYTAEDTKLTYCNAEWLASATVERIADSLAHEYGHIACGCADEWKARAYAKGLRH